MSRKNTFINELKAIISSSNYSFDDVPEEVIPIFVSFFEALLMLEMNLILLINFPISLVLLSLASFLAVILGTKLKFLVIIM